MRICLICTEIFAWGKYGGFGRATRTIGRELAKRGVRVFAVVPRRGEQRPVEELDGITVLGFPPHRPWEVMRLARACDADVYHSCEPSSSTYFAQLAMPGRKHIVTFRDPRDRDDWKVEFRLPSRSRTQVLVNWLYEANPLIAYSVRRLDVHYVAFHDGAAKVRRMFGDAVRAEFLPTPVSMPATVRKAERPTVCYLARLDRRKRPQLFFALAERFPEVRFVAAGSSRDKAWETELRRAYRHLPNLEILGFVDQFSSAKFEEILGQSWVLVNTAAREGLPNAFLEATGRGCAILSAVDTDGFASRFGYHAAEEDFARGLAWLLENDRWRAQGEAGCAYVRETFEMSRAIQLHLDTYRDLLTTRRHGQSVGQAAQDAI